MFTALYLTAALAQVWNLQYFKIKTLKFNQNLLRSRQTWVPPSTPFARIAPTKKAFGQFTHFFGSGQPWTLPGNIHNY